MRINTNLYFNQLLKDDWLQFIEEGNLIYGKIEQLEGQTTWIYIKGFGSIKAAVEGDIKELVGKKNVAFVVKSIEADKIKLKLVSDEGIKDRPVSHIRGEKYLYSILKKFNVRIDETALELLDNFFKYNVKADKENFQDGINILDKLNQIIHMKADDIVVSINPKETTETVKKQDIRNLFVVSDEKDVNIKGTRIEIDPSIIEGLKEVGPDIIKTVAFFVKHRIKPTLDNIRFFIELNEKPESFLKDYEILKKFLNNEFTNIHKNIIIKNKMQNPFDDESKKEYIQWLNEKIDFLESKIIDGDEKVSKALKEYIDKIGFIKEMNKELIFIYLPFSIEKSHKDGILTLIKNKKRKGKPFQNTNVYINLNTNSFGELKIICNIMGLHIHLKFSNISREYVDFFKTREEELIKLIEPTGYEIASITYNTDDSIKLLDTLIENPNPMYYLNIKV